MTQDDILRKSGRARQEFASITAIVPHATEWKHLQRAIVLYQDFRNRAFILVKTQRQ